MALWNPTPPDGLTEKPAEKPTLTPTPLPQSAPNIALKSSAPRERDKTVFGPGVTIEGKIEGDANVRIGGKFKGEIEIKGDLELEKTARLGAKIHAGNVTIGGHLEGNVVSTGQVKLLESGQLIGDLKANTLTVAAGSRMRGHVEFGWSPSETVKFTNGGNHDDKADKNGRAG